MQEIKISVVVPVYNVGAYLEKCLDSIIHQTYKNLEIFCIDDGSTDNSGEICDRFQEIDSRITVIHKENGGVSVARNVGIERCAGDFISFVDGDDWLEPNMYEVLIGNVVSDDIDISSCGYFEDEDNISKPVVNRFPVPEQPMDTRDFLPYIYIRDNYRGVASYLWTRLFRRELLMRENIRFVPNIRPGQDVVFTAQYFAAARRSVYTKTPLYHYVQREGSVMHDAKQRLRGMGSCVAYQMIIDLFEKEKIDQAVVDYVKRFYVYHASCLLKIAVEYQVEDKIELLKENIRKYFDVYVKTNQEHPERAEEIRQLLNGVQ